MNDFNQALESFADVFATELQADAASVPKTADVYSYAIMAPDDPGNLYIVSQIAKISGFHSEMSSMTDLAWWERILFMFADRYTDPFWEDSRDSFMASNASLNAIQKQWFTIEREAEWAEQLDQLYSTMLRKMHSIEVTPSSAKTVCC